MLIKRAIGDNLRTIISQSLVKSIYEAFKEFGSNSYDADATLFSTDVLLNAGRTIFEDNGTGMDEHSIKDFYRMGDSEKVKNPISQKGRNKIGQFGIATVLLEYLADSYLLETWKDGKKITLEEDFTKKKKSGSALDYYTESASAKKHGTKITLNNLRFTDEVKFSIVRLKQKLLWELPHIEDFKIRVNGDNLSRSQIQNSKLYIFDEKLTNGGSVKGEIHYFHKYRSHDGIYINVDGRTVGDPSDFDLTKIDRAMPHHILGFIEANCLRPNLSFNRARLNENEPTVEELIRRIYRSIRNIKTDINKVGRLNRAREVVKFVPEAIETIKKKLPSTPLKSIHKQRLDSPASTKGCGSKILTKINPKNRFNNNSLDAFVDNLNEKTNGNGQLNVELLSKIDNNSMCVKGVNSNTIYLNGQHPFYEVFYGNSNHNNLDIKFTLSTILALSKSDVLEHDEFGLIKNKLAKFDERIYDLSSTLFGTKSNIMQFFKESSSDENTTRFINPHRMYQFSEVVTLTDLRTMSMHRLTKSGLLPQHAGKYFGKEILAYLSKADAMVPAIDVIYDIEESKTIDKAKTRQAFEIRIKNTYNNLIHFQHQIDYIHNIGIDEPFILVEKEWVQQLVSLVAGKYMRKGKSMKHLPAELTRKNSVDSYLSITGIQDRLNLDLESTLKLFDFAKYKGIPIGSTVKDHIEVYRYGDIIQVHKELQN